MPDSDSLASKLESARRELLDLSCRNRLLSTPRGTTRSTRLEVLDERSDQIYRLLVLEQKAMTFLPRADGDAPADSETDLLPQPEVDSTDDKELAARHTDHYLQTGLTSEELQRRLLGLYYDARTFQEEQGVNILYLALGFLKWFEDDRSERHRFAPLILVPVELDRSSANARFRLRYTGDEIVTNLSLQEKLKAEFGLELPDLPDADELCPSQYGEQVGRIIADKPRWSVEVDDIVLWFFSFAKFLMFRDLQGKAWPSSRPLEDRPLVRGLLEQAFASCPPICEESEHLDAKLEPEDLVHVVDADGSQAVTIAEARRGRNLVVQGPPGTGKSQTITNVIAASVCSGKRVLFVAEKMAALEVVKRRLDSIGLGDICLELHSHKTNKRKVLDELARTLQLGPPKLGNIERQLQDLRQHRERLNRHVDVMHTPLEPAGVTPYQIVGWLVELHAAQTPAPTFRIEGPLAWSRSDYLQREAEVRDLATHLEVVGVPREHPWCGVELQAILPGDVERLFGSLPGILDRQDRLAAAAGALAGLLEMPAPETLGEVAKMAQFARRLSEAPPSDPEALAGEVWERDFESIGRLVERGKRLAALRRAWQGQVAEVAWTTDWADTRRALAAHGRSWLRFLRRDYRAAVSTLRGIARGPLPKALDARLELVDGLIEAQGALREIQQASEPSGLGAVAFGRLWRGDESDWEALERLMAWEAERRASGMPPHFRRLAGVYHGDPRIPDGVRAIAQELKPLHSELQQVFGKLKLNPLRAFGRGDLKAIPLDELAARLRRWPSEAESLSRWIAFFLRLRRLPGRGLGEFSEQIHAGQIPAAMVVASFRRAYYEALMRSAMEQRPELAAFDGASHQKLLERFRTLDRQRLEIARQEVALAHYQAFPAAGEAGEVGLLRREMKKKTRHLPLRRLLAEAGHAVQAIKPVFMMSPISVAQYLEPGVLEFDLLLIDEASQVRPVDALGALARARQAVVVGDDRQLPPTHFFDRVVNDEGGDESTEEFHAGDMESILGLCEAQGMAGRMLRWHYRSRHHSLIAVSNAEFYDSRLFVVVSPDDRSEARGLRFHHIAQGVFDRGRSRTNRIEARAVVEAVMEHARRCPGKSLGVGAFSVAQRDAILSELEVRRRQQPELEAFFAGQANEPFFVKNLENIQGDERDVIYISVGYGRDASGYMSMNFGPLNADGGERRLNVLITRARERCEVFASITADDIDVNRARGRGVQALKTFLSYAQLGILDTPKPALGEFHSEFERQVGQAIAGHGYQVDAQVGVAGFFIDLAVRDPDCPGRYLLGIECDGASYHSARWARDRDRLREQVLRDRGWSIHRIWSTDWWRRPEEQLRRVLGAIETARGGNGKPGPATPGGHPPRKAGAPLERHEASADQRRRPPVEAVPYKEADFEVDTALEIHELPLQDLVAIVTRIVAIEGPVHQDEIARRVVTLWGRNRTGSRIVQAVEAALSEAVHRGALLQRGLFFQGAELAEVPIRDRRSVRSAGLRKADYLPPEEVRKALEAVIDAHHGMTPDEAVQQVGRLLGFKSTGSQLREVVQDEVRLLRESGELEERGGRLYVRHAQTQPVSS